jgi:GT2 family glycosyltransferase
MVSVVAVNHNSSALLKECLSSIVSTMGNEPFEFLAVDSGSREEEIQNVRSLEGGRVRVILSRENIGYAGGVNRGVREARGDHILITNPDVVYKQGSIRSMVAALSTLPGCGAVGPKTWWNKGMTFLLPVSELVTPYRILRTDLMRISGTARDMMLRGWIKKTSEYWLSEKPVRQEMLSGACIMTTRGVLERVGGFDDSFPLYFEDTDWCLRVRKSGYHLHMVPDAHVVHYYDQSAKQDRKASREKYGESLNIYLGKHFKGKLPLLRTVLKLLKGRNKVSAIYEDRGALTTPPRFTFSDESRKLFLLSPIDSLIPSAGSFFEGTFFRIPEDLWGLLGEGRYFAKAFDLRRFKDCGSWSWVKQ